MPLAPRRFSHLRASATRPFMPPPVITAMPRLNVSRQEAELILRIVTRADRLAAGYGHALSKRQRLHLQMDLTACHANGCRLRLRELLEAGEFDFTNDVWGISARIDRATGALTRNFMPRYASITSTPEVTRS